MKKQTVNYSEEPANTTWKFDAKTKPLDAMQQRALGMPENNPPGTAYERTEADGLVTVKPQRGGARPGAGRKASGNVRLQLLVPPETRAKLEKIAAREHITLSEVVSRAIANA